MKVAIMQPYFFPYLGYWQLINSVDVFVIYDDVNFIKQGYINRNNILVNNNLHRITLELIGASSYKLIKDIKIGRNRLKLLKTIEMEYKKAPYFNKTFQLLTKIFEYKENNLALFLSNSLKMLSDYLEISTEFINSSYIEKNNLLKGQDKIIEICKKLSADTYINAIGGQSLYNKSDFEKENIKLNFIQMRDIKYKQFTDKFIPNLSIIDVMMFNDKEIIKSMLMEYDLI